MPDYFSRLAENIKGKRKKEKYHNSRTRVELLSKYNDNKVSGM